jgi:hypothetical protein
MILLIHKIKFSDQVLNKNLADFAWIGSLDNNSE